MEKKDHNPDQIVHAHVRPGEAVVLNEHAYGDRATLQVPRRVARDLAVDEVAPANVPDVAHI